MSNPSPRRVIPLKLERSSSLSAAERTAVLEACERGKKLPGGLLPILHAVQDALGFVPSDAIPVIAHELNLSRADVHGVLTFYADLRTSPPGEVHVEVCRGEACQSLGAHVLAEHAEITIGVRFKETTSDGSITLDEVFCFGNCALGPTVRVDGCLHGRVDPARFDELLGARLERAT